MDPTILAWALALPAGNRWRGLVDAYTSGTLRVTYEGRTVEYRALADIAAALAAGHAAEVSTARRPGVTLASFSREGTR